LVILENTHNRCQGTPLALDYTAAVDRLAEDHANARALAVGLAQIPGLRIDPDAIATNIVYVGVEKKGVTAPALAAALEAEGVRVLPTAPDRLRAVLHYHITGDQVQRALAIFSRMSSLPAGCRLAAGPLAVRTTNTKKAACRFW
jgi:threonine aldolase